MKEVKEREREEGRNPAEIKLLDPTIEARQQKEERLPCSPKPKSDKKKWKRRGVRPLVELRDGLPPLRPLSLECLLLTEEIPTIPEHASE